MNIYIHDSLFDIERRIQEILDDIRSLKEQSFYSYESDASNPVIQEELEATWKESFDSQFDEHKSPQNTDHDGDEQ